MSKSEMIIELQSEVNALKAKLGGYQTSNENYRKTNEKLKAELSLVRNNLDAEMRRNEEYDKKNSEAINQFYREKKILHIKIAELAGACADYHRDLEKVREEYEALKALPWYKKIFAK